MLDENQKFIIWFYKYIGITLWLPLGIIVREIMIEASYRPHAGVIYFAVMSFAIGCTMFSNILGILDNKNAQS